MAYLYDSGWRQGSVLRFSLHFSTIGAPSSIEISEVQDKHDLWVVVAQDCDLAVADENSDEPIIELRPVYEDSKARPSGIRSRELVLMDSQNFFLHAQSPRVMASPLALAIATLSTSDALDNPLGDHELTRLKTWAGKRYDRPAVPEEFAQLARNIAAAVTVHRRDAIVHGIRDVLWQAEMSDPPRFSLYAVLADGTNQNLAQEWLTAMALEVPIEIGVPDEIEAAPATQISLRLIETSYSADVSDITWHRGNPQGAL